MSRPPYPPYPPFPPYPAQASPPPYPPFPPYQPVVIAADGSVMSPSGAPVGGAAGTATLGNPLGHAPDEPKTNGPPNGLKSGDERQPPGTNIKNPVAIYFNYGRYDVVDSTNEGVGSGQLKKLTDFVAFAVSKQATEIAVDGFASPEDNLPNAQLPLHRANAVRNRLDALFAATPIKPTIKTGTTNVLSGTPATYPQLRRANVYIVSPKL